MPHQNKEEIDIRTFNQAKKYAEEILFPMMENYQKFMRQSDFGTENLEDAKMYSEEIREIERFNGLKGSVDVLFNLINTIRSTVILKNNKEEKEMINTIIGTLEKAKILFYNHKERFFVQTYRNGRNIEIIDREYFEKVKKIIITCYVNTEILLTKNKLLFSDTKDDFQSDEEIMESIKREYSGD